MISVMARHLRRLSSRAKQKALDTLLLVPRFPSAVKKEVTEQGSLLFYAVVFTPALEVQGQSDSQTMVQRGYNGKMQDISFNTQTSLEKT